MIDSLYIATNQITNLVNGINKKNYKHSLNEINQLLEQYKSDAEYHLFRVLFSSVDFSTLNDSKSTKDFHKCQLLTSEVISRISKPIFPSLICRAIDYPLSCQKSLKPNNQLLLQISKVLKLNKVHEVVLGLCLMESMNKETSNLANQWVRQKLPDILRCYVDGDYNSKEGEALKEASMEIIHLITSSLLNDKDKFGIAQDQLSLFFTAIAKDLPKEEVPVVLSAVLDNVDDFLCEKRSRSTTYVCKDINYLANIIEEMGSLTTDDLCSMLSDFDSKLISPSAVAKCICMFMRTSNNSVDLTKISSNDYDKESIWNLSNFFHFICEKNSTLNKRQVIEELDCKEFDASSKCALKILHSCISYCAVTFPVDFFYSQWKNPFSQFSFLKSCLMNQDVLSLSSWTHRKCDLSMSNFDEDQQEIHGSYWMNMDYVDALLRLSDVGLLPEVSDLFNIPMNKYPSVLVCSLVQLTTQNGLKSRLLLKLFTGFITNTSVKPSFFSVAWKYEECKPLIMRALYDCYKESENYKNLSCVPRIADIISDIKAVPYILPNSTNIDQANIFRANTFHFRYEAVHFALDIAIFCTNKNRSSTNKFLAEWVNELLMRESDQLQNFKTLVSYVHLRYTRWFDNEDSKFVMPKELILDPSCLHAFLGILDQIGRAQFLAGGAIKAEMHAISYMMSKLAAPPVTGTVATTTAASLNALSAVVPKASSRNKLDPTRSAFVPQSEMNRIDLSTVLPSDHQQSHGDMGGGQDLASSTSKFVPQQLRPTNVPGEDKIQSQTVEQEIEKNFKLLFEGSITVQTMCDLYCNPNNSKREHLRSLTKVLLEELNFIYQYPEKQGKIYSDLFIQILNLDNSLISKAEFNKLYESLINTQTSLNNSNSNGREIVERIVNFVHNNQKSRDPNSPADTGLVSLNAVTAPNAFGNIDSPPENVTEKVFFIINNVSKMNVQEKAAQLSEVVTMEHVAWFAQYIVMKRVTTEANFHDLFIQLIDCMADQLAGLKEKVLTETYRNIKILLANMKNDLTDFNDRQLLKNLGKFLGMITLAKNKPILHDDMNLKDLLHEAYNKGHVELHYVVPFVTKTLEAAKDSIVFRPPCPWTTAILKVLKELHEVENVKLNLKFEVEILCRNLKLDFNKLSAAFFLNDRNVRIEAALCRTVPSGSSQQPLSSSAAPAATANSDMLHNDSLGLQGGPFDGRVDSHQQQQQQQVRAIGQRQQQQNLETLEANNSRGALIRPNLYPYQHPMSTNQQTPVRSTNQDVSQYYPAPVSAGYGLGVPQQQQPPPPTLSSNQSTLSITQSSSVGNQMAEHGHAPLRALAIPYDDLSTATVSVYLNIEDIPQPILMQIPNLKNQLLATMEKIVMDLVSPLYDRCAKITIGTVDQLVVKDFGVDCDINTIKQYAFGMCRNLTAGLCLVTAREIVVVNLNNAVKQTIFGEYRHVNSQDKEQVENFASKIVATNNEICVAFLQKVVSEKAIVELEKRLNVVIGLDDVAGSGARKRNQPKPTAQELQVYECFSRNIPGFPSLPSMQGLSNNMQGTWNSMMQHQRSQPTIRQYAVPNSDTIVDNPINRMISEIERQMNFISSITRNESIIRSLRQIIDIAYLTLQNNDPQLIHRLMREIVGSFMTMYHSQILRDCQQGLEIMERLKEAHMYSLRIMQPYEETSGFVSVNKQVTLAWTNMEEPKQIRQNGPGKWNGEAFSELLKNHVISLPSMDVFLAKKISENNISALIFVLDLLKYFVTGDKREFTVLNEFDLSATIEALSQLQMKLPQDVSKQLAMSVQKIGQLMDLGMLGQSQASVYLYNGISLSREFDDPPTMPERSEIMIRHWMDHYCSPGQRDPMHVQTLVNNMVHSQLVHNDESFVRFLRLATVYVVERAHKHLKQDAGSSAVPSVSSGTNRSASYTEIDAYAFLVTSVVQRCPLGKGEVTARSCLLNKALGIVAGTLLQEHEVRRDWFHPMPFQRILIMLFNELQLCVEEEEALQPHVLTAFAHTFHVIRPKCAPSFVFSWLELIAHRAFLAKMLLPSSSVAAQLEGGGCSTHSMYVQLVADLLLFLRPYLENLHLPRPVQMVYRGAVSLACLLMHDFPDLLIQHHSLLCALLPANCYQLRNIVLCTSPRSAQFPDVTRPLHVEQLSQVEDPAGPSTGGAGARIRPADLRQQLDSYLASRQPVKFLSELVNGLRRRDATAGPDCSSGGTASVSVCTPKEVAVLLGVPEDHVARSAVLFQSTGVVHYDLELMSSVVLYLCVTAVRVLRDKNIPLNINTIAHTPQMDIIQSLVLNLDNEGRFLLLNCMANQLRYPNSHSYYFIFTFLYLFAEQPQESVKEQITRVILERIIVNRPHPWGLLHLMNELFKNPAFWNHKFVHCSEQVENILDSVVKGCRTSIPSSADDITTGGGGSGVAAET